MTNMTKKTLLDRIKEEGQNAPNPHRPTPQPNPKPKPKPQPSPPTPYDHSHSYVPRHKQLDDRVRLWHEKTITKESVLPLVYPDVSINSVMMQTPRRPWTDGGNFARVYKISVGARKDKKILRVWTSTLNKKSHDQYSGIEQSIEKVNNLSEYFSAPNVQYFPAPSKGFQMNSGQRANCSIIDFVQGTTLGHFLKQTYNGNNVSKPFRMKLLRHVYFVLAKTYVGMRDASITHGDVSPGNLMITGLRNLNHLHIKLVDLDSLAFHGKADKKKIDVSTSGHPDWANPHWTKDQAFSEYWFRHCDLTPILLLLIKIRVLLIALDQGEENIPLPIQWQADVDESFFHSRSDLENFPYSEIWYDLKGIDGELDKLVSWLGDTLGSPGLPPSKKTIESVSTSLIDYLEDLVLPNSFSKSEAKKLHQIILGNAQCDFCQKPIELVFFEPHGVLEKCDCSSHPQCKTCNALILGQPDRNNTYYCSTCNHTVDTKGNCTLSECFACESVNVKCQNCRNVVRDFPVDDLVYCPTCEHMMNKSGVCQSLFCTSCSPGNGICKTCTEPFVVHAGIETNYECKNCEHFMNAKGECVLEGACLACQTVKVKCKVCRTVLHGYLPEHPKYKGNSQTIQLPCKICRHVVDIDGNCTDELCLTCNVFY